jgi:hypothetical protein
VNNGRGLAVADVTHHDRLDSWKEIAVYLGRGVRTVQRWEREEALPVRRHAHSRQASVYAFRSEIDHWRRGREQAPAPSTPVLVLLVLPEPWPATEGAASAQPRLALVPQRAVRTS